MEHEALRYYIHLFYAVVFDNINNSQTNNNTATTAAPQSTAAEEEKETGVITTAETATVGATTP